MKNISITLIYVLGTFFIKAQAPAFQWAKDIGGTGYDYGYAITLDTFGNSYTIGTYRGTADFNPGDSVFNITSKGADDIFIVKLDAAGNFVWARSVGSPIDDRGLAIAVDAAGNVYATGYFLGTADFDPGAATYNLSVAFGTYEDIFVLKLNASGNFVWAKRMGGSSDDYGYSIAVDAAGNVFTTGSFKGTADFDPGTATFNLKQAGNGDMFVSKLDASGNFVWAKKMGGIWYDQGSAISLDAAGNIYTTGKFSDTADFDPGAGVYNLIADSLTDIFVSKLNASGNFIWAKRIGGSSHDEGYDIAFDKSGNICIGGTFCGLGNGADFDPGSGTLILTSYGYHDVFVLKLDTSGSFIWARNVGGLLTSITGYAIVLDPSDNVYITGNFYNKVDFNPGAGTVNRIASNNGDIFILKLDASGNYGWVEQFGWVSESRSIAMDKAGNIYTTGFFTYKADFDPGADTAYMTPYGLNDMFVLKLGQCPSIDLTTKLNGSTIQSNQSGASYQWIDCNNGNKPIAGETKQSFSAKANGQYAVIIKMGNCFDTSSCIDVTTIGLREKLGAGAFSIYPNPSHGQLNIAARELVDGLCIEVYNHLGALVCKKIMVDATTTIDLTNFADGLYIVKIIINGQSIANRKIIKD